MPTTRRHFLGTAVAGAGVLTMPGWLAGCAHRSGGAGPLAPMSANPFYDWFGLEASS